MANNTTISIGFRVEDAGNGLHRLTVDADGLRQVMRANVEEAQRLDRSFVDFAAVCTSIDSVSNTLNSLKSVVDDLAGAYDVQIEAEARLEQVMRNTMNASSEAIQSIKDFCSAQQQIGVVGDEVQLAGAQELATYVTMTGSLKRLIPVMNDMLVQQNGLSASGEQAAQIAGMLGKVLDGQTGALSRYGYKFDEEQENLLKFGTEEQRVATLADVVSQSVGGMNQAMARTESGRMQQVANTLGDVKEQLGGIVKSAQAPLTIAANATIALGGVMKLVQGIKALNAVLTTTQIVSGGIGIALAALASVITYLCLTSDDAADSIDRLTDAEERAARASEMAADRAQTESEALRGAEAAINNNITRLKEFNGTKAEEKKVVEEMNATYGTCMGYFSSVAEWYNTLIANSKTYCEQMVIEAKTRRLTAQIAELDEKRRGIARDEKGNKKKYSSERKETYRYITREEVRELEKQGKRVDGQHVAGKYRYSAWMPEIGSSEAEKMQAAYDDLTEQRQDLQKQLEDAWASKPKMPVMGADKKPEFETPKAPKTPKTPKTPKAKEPKEKTRLQEINELLQKENEAYLKASDSQKAAIREKVAILLKEKNTIELTLLELQRPVSLDSLEAFSKELAYQNKLRETASEERLAGIDEEIARIRKEQFAFESKAATDLQCLQDFEDELSRLQTLRKDASAEALAQLDAEIRKLEKRRTAFERSSVAPLGNVADANTLEEISEAITLLDERIQRASADEIDALARSRMEFEKKREAFERGIRIPEMQREVADIMKLPEEKMRVKVEAIGFDALSEKIEEIRRQLADLDNPPTDGQRAALEELMKVYEGWRRECALSFDTLSDGWGNVRNIGSGMESLAQSLTENGNAWKRLTSMVDGFISLANDIMAIGEIMKTLGVISKANTVAKTAEAAATTAATTAAGVESAMAETTVAAALPVVEANKSVAASFVEVAAAEFMAAHASIPFIGFGIGSGFASATAGLVKGLGAVSAFADGGIVYGPTLGLVGEYAGASSNPEVIAPLSKLRDIIGSAAPGGPVVVGGRVEVDGRKLAIVLENQSRVASASGRKYK